MFDLRPVRLLAVVVLLASCSDTTVTELSEVVRVDIDPPEATIIVGGTVDLRALPKASDGRTLFGKDVSWSTSTASIATISELGRVTGVGEGQVEVRAIVQGQTGSAMVTVQRAPVSRIEVSTPADTIQAGDSVQLTAIPRSPSNAALDGRTILWSTSDSTVATVSQAGWVRGVAPGRVQVTAESEGASAFVSLTITPAPIPVTSILVMPATDTLFVGDTLQLIAQTLGPAGEVLVDRPIAWSTSSPSIAPVSPAGRVQALGEGSVVITASSEGITGIADLTVIPIPPPLSVASIQVTPSVREVMVGQRTTFAAIALAADGTPLEDRVITWSTNRPSVATVSNTGEVQALTLGEATVTASAEGVGGLALVRVIPEPEPIADIEVQVPPEGLSVGGSTQLVVVLRDASGNVVEGREVTFTSSDTMVAIVSETGLVTAVGPGTAIITVTSEGVETDFTITVAPAQVTTVVVTPSAPSVVAGQTIQLSASALDAGGSPIFDLPVTWRSLGPAVATVSEAGVVTGIAPGSVAVVATIEGVDGFASVFVIPPPEPVARVQVSPAQEVLLVGGAVDLVAILSDPAGAPLTDRDVAWTSSDPAVASVSGSGRVQGLSTGEATITATSEGESGTALIRVVTELEPVVSVEVDTPTSTFEVGTSIQLTATARGPDGAPLVGRGVVWESANPGVATVSPAGEVTGHSPGTARITATVGGVSGSVTLTILPIPVASVEVSPASGSLVAGSSVQLVATPRAADGTPLAGREIQWDSSDPDVAMVSPTGRVEGIAPGSVTITARSEGVSGAAEWTVTPVPVATVSLSSTSETLQVGRTAQLSVTLQDGSGNELEGREVVWESGSPAVATVSETGLVTAVSIGQTTVSATSEGQSASATITVVTPSVVRVEVTPAEASVPAGETVQLTATPRDDQDAPVLGRLIQWSTSNPSVATVSSSGRVTAQAPGTTFITARSDGISGVSTITVTAVPVATVEVVPAADTIQVGTTVQLAATLRDAGGAVLSGRPVLWSSSNPSVAAVSTGGLVIALAPGTTTITATSEGKEGTASIVVDEGGVATVEIAPGSVPLGLGQAFALSAIVRDAGGNELTRPEVTWSSDDPEVAAISATGVVQGVSPGTTQIRAQADGVEGTALVQVFTVILGPEEVVGDLSSGDGAVLIRALLPDGVSSFVARTSQGTGSVRIQLFEGSDDTGPLRCDRTGISPRVICAIETPSSGVWTIRLSEGAAGAFEGVQVEVNPFIPQVDLGGEVVAVSNVGGDPLFRVNVPVGTPSLLVRTVEGTGSLRMRLYQGDSPGSPLRCDDSRSGGTGTLCAIDSPQAGVWSVQLSDLGATLFEGVRLEVNPVLPAVPLGGVLEGLAFAGEDIVFHVDVPPGTSALTVRTSQGTGNVILSLYDGPTPASPRQCLESTASTAALCSTVNPRPGIWTVRVTAPSGGSFSGVRLEVNP